jgi:hypothetical protein
MSTSILLLLLLLLLHSVFNTASPMLPVPIPVQVSDPKASFLALTIYGQQRVAMVLQHIQEVMGITERYVLILAGQLIQQPRL